MATVNEALHKRHSQSSRCSDTKLSSKSLDIAMTRSFNSLDSEAIDDGLEVNFVDFEGDVEEAGVFLPHWLSSGLSTLQLATIRCIPAWLLDDGRNDRWRRSTIRLLRSTWFEPLLGIVIALNIYVVIKNVDANAHGGEVSGFLQMSSHFFTVFYICELALRFFARRLRMFKDPFCVLDLMLVIFDLVNLMIGTGSPHASFMRIARIVKVARTFKFMKSVPELYLMMKGLVGAGKAILWGSILLFVVVLISSILAVVLIHPINKEIAEQVEGPYAGCYRCGDAYASVFEAAVTICQTIVAGDSWGTYAVPVIQKVPITAVYFYAVFASIASATMNLILAVIVDSALDARKLSTEEEANVKKKEWRNARRTLSRLCKQLDEDESGILSLAELQEGFEKYPEFGHALAIIGIHEEDMPQLFGLMDHDGSGDVQYNEFVKELWKIQSNDLHSMLVSVRLFLTQIRKQVLEEIAGLSKKLDERIDAHEHVAEKKMKALERKFVSYLDNSVSSPTRRTGLTLYTSSIVDQGQSCRFDALINKLEQMETSYKENLAAVVATTNELKTSISTGRSNVSQELLAKIHASVIELSCRVQTDIRSATSSLRDPDLEPSIKLSPNGISDQVQEGDWSLNGEKPALLIAM